MQGHAPVLPLLEDPHWIQTLRLLDWRDAVLFLLHLDHGRHLLPWSLRGRRATCHRHGRHRRGLRWRRRGTTTGGRGEVLLSIHLAVTGLTCTPKDIKEAQTVAVSLP